ncbi:hypothetical protein F6P93_06300 [Escherichia coli]|nr:hypothetical protein F6P93_06300 [Escherichia coli]
MKATNVNAISSSVPVVDKLTAQLEVDLRRSAKIGAYYTLRVRSLLNTDGKFTTASDTSAKLTANVSFHLDGYIGRRFEDNAARRGVAIIVLKSLIRQELSICRLLGERWLQ